jgi:hypothetical protein
MSSDLLQRQGGIMKNPVSLSIGDSLHLGTGKDHIIYAGMPSENVYSIVQRRRKFAPYAVWGYAWNLFYPKSRTSFTIDGVTITVDSVTPEEIRLRVG